MRFLLYINVVCYRGEMVLRLASEKDRREVLDYCLDEQNINLFIIGDIEILDLIKNC